MTVLDLINKSAIMLNVQEILNDESLKTITTENEQELLNDNFVLKRLYELSKIVINEINSYSHVSSVEINSLFYQIEIPNSSIGEDVFVYGLNAYYCLAVGLYSEYNIYIEHYNKRIDKFKNLKVFKMPCRSWQ